MIAAGEPLPIGVNFPEGSPLGLAFWSEAGSRPGAARFWRSLSLNTMLVGDGVWLWSAILVLPSILLTPQRRPLVWSPEVKGLSLKSRLPTGDVSEIFTQGPPRGALTAVPAAVSQPSRWSLWSGKRVGWLA